MGSEMCIRDREIRGCPAVVGQEVERGGTDSLSMGFRPVSSEPLNQSAITAKDRVIVRNVRVSLCRRPPTPGVRTHTVTDFLPMSSPATRSNITSIATTTDPFRRDTRSRRHSEGPLTRTQTHVLAATIRHTRGPRVIHVYGLTRTSVSRRRRATPQFSSLGARKELPHRLHVWQSGVWNGVTPGSGCSRHRSHLP